MKSNTIPLILVTLLLAAGAYWYLTSSSGNQAPLTATTAGDNAAQAQFQALVGQLRRISFNTDIFSDPKFTTLVNLSVPVTPEPSGRLDPFARVAGVTGQ